MKTSEQYPTNPEYVLATLQLFTTLAMQGFLMLSKHYGAGSFVLLTQMYFYGFALANIVLAFQHILNVRQEVHARNVMYRSRTTFFCLVLGCIIIPSFFLQFCRQSSLRFGTTIPVESANWKFVFLYIIAFFFLSLIYPRLADFDVALAYLANGGIAICLIGLYAQFFKDFQVPSFHRIKLLNVAHILPDITTIIAPITLITISLTFLPEPDHEKYLSILLSTAVTGVVSSILQSLAIRNTKVSIKMMVALFLFSIVCASLIGVIVVGLNVAEILFIQLLTVLGLCQGYFVKWFRAEAPLRKKIIFCLTWCVYLFGVTILIKYSESLIALFAVLLVSYIINLSFSTTTWQRRHKKNEV